VWNGGQSWHQGVPALNLDPALSGATMINDYGPTAIDAIESTAWVDSYEAVDRARAVALGMNQTISTNSAGLAMRAISGALFNRFQLFDIDPSNCVDELRAGVRWLEGHAAPNPVAIDLVAPTGSPQRAFLEASGMDVVFQFAKFRRDASPVAPVGYCPLDVREIDATHAADFAHIAQRSFELPEAISEWLKAIPGRKGWRVYVAYDGSTPAATGAMFLKGDMAWLGWGSTLSDFRNLGAQLAILNRRVRDGIAAGTRIFTIETGAPTQDGEPGTSYRNIVRAGFELSHLRQLFKHR
jgi:hypothetical protein